MCIDTFSASPFKLFILLGCQIPPWNLGEDVSVKETEMGGLEHSQHIVGQHLARTIIIIITTITMIIMITITIIIIFCKLLLDSTWPGQALEWQSPTQSQDTEKKYRFCYFVYFFSQGNIH